jgi:hypothetical protein
MIITGDITQVDLAANQRSGMVEAMDYSPADRRDRAGGTEPTRHREAPSGPEHRRGLSPEEEAAAQAKKRETS